MISRIAFVACFCLATPAFGLIIDDFSVGDITVEVDYDTPSNAIRQTGLDTSTVIGGTRYIGLLLDQGQPGEGGAAIVDTTTQTLRMQATTLGGFETSGVAWATFADPGTALNADLLADGANAFQMDVVSLSDTIPFRLLLRSGFDEGAMKEDSWTVRLPPSDVPYSVQMAFSLFPEVDFTDIDYISLDASTPRFSLTLDAIRTVPEPSTLAMLILGLIGVWMRRR